MWFQDLVSELENDLVCLFVNVRKMLKKSEFVAEIKNTPGYTVIYFIVIHIPNISGL